MSQEVISEIAKQYGIHRRGVSLKNQTQFWRRCIEEQSSGLEKKIYSVKDVADIPTDVIVDIMSVAESEESASKKEELWNKYVAPNESIILDAEYSLEDDNLLFTSPEMSTIFSLKAGEGHSHFGHGAYKKSNPNTTTDKILDTIEMDAPNLTGELFTKEKFRTQNQHAVDNIVYAVEDWFEKTMKNIDYVSSSDAITCLTNSNGVTPLNGFSFYDGLEINMIEFARGFYFTSLMDNLHDIRAKGFEKYGHMAGGGESHLVDMQRLKRNGINLSDLSKVDYKGLYGFMNDASTSKKIDILINRGIFLDKQFNWNNFNPAKTNWNEIKEDSSIVDIINNPEYLGQYMRESKGGGVGDDIAIYLASFLPNTFRTKKYNKTPHDMHSRMMGGLMADQIDTLEKDTRLYFPGGQDEFVGKYFNELFKHACKNGKFRKAFGIQNKKDEGYTLVDEDVIVDYTMASANIGKDHVHSSQRWFYRDIGESNRKETCALKEEIKHMYKISLSMGEEMSYSDLPKHFEFNRYGESGDVLLTFKKKSLSEVLKIFDQRLDLVRDPNTREEKLLEFYSK
ncbi:hypothetical protein KAS08_05365 [Candidatus Pacearchaeota archaeon]|nr:hypothetical protein [Candidatus Pacearchaeota archaeon]